MVNQEAVPSNNMRRARRGNAVGATICALLLFSVKRGFMSLGDMIAISPAEPHDWILWKFRHANIRNRVGCPFLLACLCHPIEKLH